jgi:hypothetical protein
MYFIKRILYFDDDVSHTHSHTHTHRHVPVLHFILSVRMKDKQQVRKTHL